MRWFDILKVNIDFDKNIRAFGQYEKRNWLGIDELLDALSADEEIEFEKIKINHQKIYNYLKDKLGREPTEKELTEWIKRTIMHESAHAGHDKADERFDERPKSEKEYIAFMLEFPESTYLALKNYLTHPETRKSPNSPYTMFFGGEGLEHHERAEIIRKLLQYINRWAKNSKDKEKLTRLELINRKHLPPYQKINFPQDLSQAKARYGNKHYKFLNKLFRG